MEKSRVDPGGDAIRPGITQTVSQPMGRFLG
jgi:hypothetical protein